MTASLKSFEVHLVQYVPGRPKGPPGLLFYNLMPPYSLEVFCAGFVIGIVVSFWRFRGFGA